MASMEPMDSTACVATIDTSEGKGQSRGLRSRRIAARAGSSSQEVKTNGLGRAASRTSSGRGRTGSATAKKARSVVKKVPRKSKSEKKVSSSASRGYSVAGDVDDAEYHYGSDFFSDEDDRRNTGALDSDESDVPIDEVSDEELFDAVSDAGSSVAVPISRSPTPLPVWLQNRVDLPRLELPPSSEDLLIGKQCVMRALSLYELIMRFRRAFRLSPFRIEDLCAALAAEEQSALLSELHVQLLKAIMRNCETQQIMFGPPDLRDVINIEFFFLDSMTWPSVLKSFFESHPRFLEVLRIVSERNYPYCDVEDRLKVLEVLIEELTLSIGVRDEMNNPDGVIQHEDFCRNCHAPGELCCCYTCPGVYHIECLQPRFRENLSDEWRCPVCVAEKVSGVTDCIDEEDRYAVRHAALGYDRHGRKYWFLCRRLVVEDVEDSSSDKEFRYYSTEAQLDELLTLFDPDDMEDKLCEKLLAKQEVIRQHMLLTLEITERHRIHGKQVYLEAEIEEAKKRIDDRKYAAEAAAKQKAEEEAVALAQALESEQALAAAQLEELNTPVDDGEKTTGETGTTSKADETIKNEGMTTRIKSGAIQPAKYSLEESLKNVKSNPAQRVDHSRPRIGSGPYKLGMEGNHKHYVNQFVTNPLALSRLQHQEEKERRQQLVRKFALGQSADFEWKGVVNGTETMSSLTLRNTLTHMLESLSAPLLHVNWPKVHAAWAKNLRDASLPGEFRLLLTVFAQCLKAPILMNVWHDGSGHTRLHMLTLAEREHLKKKEKKELKEREALEERSKLSGSFVKYTLGLKHQLFRQKGEDYRIHGQGGWFWVSRARLKRSSDMNTCGLRAGPARCLVQGASGFECVSLEELKKRAQKFPDLGNFPHGSRIAGDALEELGDIFSPDDDESEERTEVPLEEIDVQCPTLDKEKLTSMLPTPDDDQLRLIDVSAALCYTPVEGLVGDPIAAKRRKLYPKFGKSAVLDALLPARLGQLKAEGQSVQRFVIRAKPEWQDPDFGKEPDQEDFEATFPDIEVEDPMVRDVITLFKQKMTVPAGSPDSPEATGYQKILHLGKVTYPWRSLKFACYSPSCPNKKRTGKEATPPSTAQCYSTFCRMRIECDRRLADLKKVLVEIKNHKQRMQRERDRKERERAERRRRLLEADPGPDDIVIYKCADRVSLRLDFLPSSFPSKRKLLRRKSVKDVGNVVIPRTSRYVGLKKVSSCLIPPAFEARRCARRKGRWTFAGYLYTSKPFPLTFWPYPCPRPAYKTTWLWTCSKMSSIHDAALQLRLLWSCLRWDAISMRPPSDSKALQPQVMADENDIIRTEILEKKQSGEFQEKTMYLVRKVVIPVDVPKATVREITPSRLGLRKRRSQFTEGQSGKPTVVEEWVSEDQLELWEIKQFHERYEKTVSIARAKEKAARDEALRLSRIAKGKELLEKAAAEVTTKLIPEPKLKVTIQGQPAADISPSAWVAPGAEVNVEVAREPSQPPAALEPGPVAHVVKRRAEDVQALSEEELRKQRELSKKRTSGRDGSGTGPAAFLEMRKREMGATAASMFGQVQPTSPKPQTLNLSGLIEGGKVQLIRSADGRLLQLQTTSPTISIAGGAAGVPQGRVVEIFGKKVLIPGKAGASLSGTGAMSRILLPNNLQPGAPIQLPPNILHAVRQQLQAQNQSQAQQILRQHQAQVSQQTLLPQSPVVRAAPGPLPTVPTPTPAPPPPQPAPAPQQEQSQIFHQPSAVDVGGGAVAAGQQQQQQQQQQQRLILTPTADGKMNVSGLLPGQQLVRTPDGTYHLVCADPNAALAATAHHAEQPQPTAEPPAPRAPEPLVPHSSSFDVRLSHDVQQDAQHAAQPEDESVALHQQAVGHEPVLGDESSMMSDALGTADDLQEQHALLQQQRLQQQQFEQQQRELEQQQRELEHRQALEQQRQLEHHQALEQQRLLEEQQQRQQQQQFAVAFGQQHVLQQQPQSPSVLQEREAFGQTMHLSVNQTPSPQMAFVRQDHGFASMKQNKPRTKTKPLGPIVQIRPGPQGPTVHVDVELTTHQKVALRALLAQSLKTVQRSNQSIFIRLPPAEVLRPTSISGSNPMLTDAMQQKGLDSMGFDDGQPQVSVDENDLQAALAQITRFPKSKTKKPSVPKRGLVDEHGFASTRRPSDFMPPPVPSEPEPMIPPPAVETEITDDSAKFVLTTDYLKQTIQAALKQGNLSEDMAKRLQTLQKIQAEKDSEAAAKAAAAMMRPGASPVATAVAAAAAATATAIAAAPSPLQLPSPRRDSDWNVPRTPDGSKSPRRKPASGVKPRRSSPAEPESRSRPKKKALKDGKKELHPELEKLKSLTSELKKEIIKKRSQWEQSAKRKIEREIMEREESRRKRALSRSASPRPSKKARLPPSTQRSPRKDDKRRDRERERDRDRDHHHHHRRPSKTSSSPSKLRKTLEVEGNKSHKTSLSSSARDKSPRGSGGIAASEASRKRKRSPSPERKALAAPPKPPASSSSKSKSKKPKLGTPKSPPFSTPRDKKKDKPAAAAASTSTPTPSPGSAFDWAIKGKNSRPQSAPKMKNTAALASRSKSAKLVVGQKRKANSVVSKYLKTAKATIAAAAARKNAREEKPKLYCVCKTPYDNTKFYVGCDSCDNWFHGACVNVTEAEASTMQEFICASCKRKKKRKSAGATAPPKVEGKPDSKAKAKAATSSAKEAETKPEPATLAAAAAATSSSSSAEAPVEPAVKVEVKVEDPSLAAAPSSGDAAVPAKPAAKRKSGAKKAGKTDETPTTPVRSPKLARDGSVATSKKSVGAGTPKLSEESKPSSTAAKKRTKAGGKTTHDVVASAAGSKSKSKAKSVKKDAVESPAVVKTEDTAAKKESKKSSAAAAESPKPTSADSKKAAASPKLKNATPPSRTPAAKSKKTSKPAETTPASAKTAAADKKKAAAAATTMATPDPGKAKKSIEPKSQKKKAAAAAAVTKTPGKKNVKASPAAASSKKAAAPKSTAKKKVGKQAVAAAAAMEVDSESDELFCLCRKPYDPTKFYICCDRCGDWFHGTCVGILPIEANDIDEYLCPNCGPKTPLNCANFALLKQSSFADLKVMLAELKALKHAAQFVDTLDVHKDPTYKKIVKDHMDLRTMEGKVDHGAYRAMKDVIADLIRIFSNCRLYFPDDSPFCKNAAKLEADVVKKVKAFRQKIARNLNLDLTGL